MIVAHAEPVKNLPPEERIRCPVCAQLKPRYELRRDRNGVPRSVDMTGTLCDACTRKYARHMR